MSFNQMIEGYDLVFPQRERNRELLGSRLNCIEGKVTYLLMVGKVYISVIQYFSSRNIRFVRYL